MAFDIHDPKIETSLRLKKTSRHFLHSPDPHNDEASKSTVTRREELGGLHEGTEHDNPNAFCLWHLDSNPEQLGAIQ